VSTAPVSIVIPAYNESARLASTLSALLEHLAGTDAEIVVVDDGSRDDTAVVVRRMLAGVPRARIVQLPENRGKGAAVRAGVAVATGDALVFMDADLATDR
jgi:glycosyltransferase involved in cell wall biosynthesis